MGSEGGRSTNMTDDSGPVKPGNGVEEKILMTRKKNLDVPAASLGHGKSWTRSDGDTDEEPT